MDHVPAGFALDPDDGELLEFGGGTVLIRAAAATTGGAFTVVEEVPPLLDTPLHVHEHDDELYHVLEGEHVFRCGDDEFTVGPGALVFLPRGIPHAHRRLIEHEGRLLAITTPAGIDGFFRALAEADAAGELGPEALATASAAHGITWLD